MVIQVGCSKSNNLKETSNSNEVTGRYVEQELKEPELKDGEKFLAIIVDDESNVAYYSLLEGEKTELWQYLLVGDHYEKKQITCFDAFLGGPDCLCNLYLGEDGLYYLLINKAELIGEKSDILGVTNSAKIYRTNKEMTSCEEVTPASWNQEDSGNEVSKGTYASNIQVTANGILFYQENYQQEILSYSLKDKKPISDFDLPASSVYIVKGNTIYYTSPDTKEVCSLNCETGEKLQYPCETLQDNAMLQVSKEGNLYLLDSNGIHRLAKGTKLWETVVDGSFASMCISTISPFAFQVKNEDKEVYYVYYRSMIQGKENSLACYRFDNTALPIVERELTIYSLWDDITLREAIAQYQKNHVGVRINYQVASSDETGITLEEQIRALNTEVLAGKGADIFLLDGLPMDSYIDKGVLLDLSDIMMPKIEDGSLMSNIAGNYVHDGAVYGMPIHFSFPVYITREPRKETSISLEQLSELAALTEKELFPIMSYKEVLQLFLFTHYNDLVSDDGELKAEKLKVFLSQVKTIAESTGINSDSVAFNQNIGGYDNRDKRILDLFTMNQIQVFEADYKVIMPYVSGMRAYIQCATCASDIGGGCYLVNNTYVPKGIIGVNKASKETELAKDFVQWVISEENQSVQVGDGFPMNTAAFHNWLDDIQIHKDDIYDAIAYTKPNGNIRVIEINYPTAEETQVLFDMTKQLTTPAMNNIDVMDMIVGEGVPYLAGEKDLQAVCASIMNRINTYLSE
jgi:hypothetical protein